MKKLGTMPKALAWLLAAAMIFVAVFCISGIGLASRCRKVEKAFISSVSGTDDQGNTFSGDIAKALNNARPIEACAAEVLPADSYARKQLTECLKKAEDSKSKPAAAFRAIGELYSAVTLAFPAIESASPEAASSVRAAYNNFLSSCSVINNTYSRAYNTYVEGLEGVSDGFPAGLIKKLWGIKGNED